MKNMKTTNLYLLGLITATLLVGCGGGTTASTTNSSTTNTSSTPTVQCKQVTQVMETLNRKYASSKDTDERYSLDAQLYKSSKGSGGSTKGSGGSGGSHNEGRNCLDCHSFASAGTVFTSLNAGNNTPGAAGYRIKLSTGTVYGSARGTGNSFTNSFPSGKYTAQVIDANGNVVNSSADMSHDASRRACNSCHSSTGNNGAPGRITHARLSSATPTGATTSACVSFNSNVLPILNAKCKSCHGSNGKFTITTANATFSNISALKGGAVAGAQYVLDKGTNTQGHGGGQVISTTSGEYTTIKAWITEGALNN